MGAHIQRRFVVLAASITTGCSGHVAAELASNGPPDAQADDVRVSDGLVDDDASRPVDSAVEAPPDAVHEAPPPDAAPTVGDGWPQFGHDVRHTGQSHSTVAASPDVVWTAELDGDHCFLPLIQPNGDTVASGLMAVHAVDRFGHTRWRIAYTVGESGGAAILPGGDVVWSEYGSTLFRVTADGDPVYQTQLEPVPGVGDTGWASPPTVADDGTLYLVSFRFHDGPSVLRAVAPDGSPRWRILLDEQRGATQPALDSQGNLIVVLMARKPDAGPSLPGRLVKLAPDGTVLWSTEFVGELYQPRAAAVAPDDSIRFGRWGGPSDAEVPFAYAYSSAGEQLPFEPGFGGLVASTPLVDTEGHSFFARAGGITAYQPDGSILWQLDAPNLDQLHMWNQAALSVDGVLIGADIEGTLWGVRDGQPLWSKGVHAVSLGSGLTPSAVAIGPDGTMVVCSEDGSVVALR